MTPPSIKNHIAALLFLLLLALNTAQAQQRVCTYYIPFSGYSDSLFVDLEKAEVGHNYVKCFIESEYETFSDSNFTVISPVISIIKNRKFTVIPPVIAEVTDSIVLEKRNPRWAINTKVHLPKGVKILPPVYKDSMTHIEIRPIRVKWIKTHGDQNCLSQNPDECLVFRLLEIPAQYKTKYYLKQIQPPRKIVGRDTIALDSAEIAKYGAIETQYQQTTYYHEVLKQIGCVEFPIADNAKYISPTKKLVRRGGMSKWGKIICCGGFVSPARISVVQKALKQRGYYNGKIDNILGAETKAALVRFQKDNGLPIGSLDLQTLKALGVNVN